MFLKQHILNLSFVVMLITLSACGGGSGSATTTQDDVIKDTNSSDTNSSQETNTTVNSNATSVFDAQENSFIENKSWYIANFNDNSEILNLDEISDISLLLTSDDMIHFIYTQVGSNARELHTALYNPTTQNSTAHATIFDAPVGTLSYNASINKNDFVVLEYGSAHTDHYSWIYTPSTATWSDKGEIENSYSADASLSLDESGNALMVWSGDDSLDLGDVLLINSYDPTLGTWLTNSLQFNPDTNGTIYEWMVQNIIHTQDKAIILWGSSALYATEYDLSTQELSDPFVIDSLSEVSLTSNQNDLSALSLINRGEDDQNDTIAISLFNYESNSFDSAYVIAEDDNIIRYPKMTIANTTLAVAYLIDNDLYVALNRDGEWIENNILSFSDEDSVLNAQPTQNYIISTGSADNVHISSNSSHIVVQWQSSLKYYDVEEKQRYFGDAIFSRSYNLETQEWSEYNIIDFLDFNDELYSFMEVEEFTSNQNGDIALLYCKYRTDINSTTTQEHKLAILK